MPVQVQRRGTGIAPTHLRSMLEWGGWSATCPSCFTPQRRPGTHHIGGWVALGLDGYGKSPLHWDLIPGLYNTHTNTHTHTHTHTNTYPAVKLNRMEYLSEVRVGVHVAK